MARFGLRSGALPSVTLGETLGEVLSVGREERRLAVFGGEVGPRDLQLCAEVRALRLEFANVPLQAHNLVRALALEAPRARFRRQRVRRQGGSARGLLGHTRERLEVRGTHGERMSRGQL